MWLSPYIANPWLVDLVAMLISFAVALAFLKLNDRIAHRGWLPEYITRKLVHIGTGPLFLLCWPLYSTTWHARWFAAFVPAGLTALFALIGLGIVKKDDFVAAMSRTGDPCELLRGPLMYGDRVRDRHVGVLDDFAGGRDPADAVVRRRRSGGRGGPAVGTRQAAGPAGQELGGQRWASSWAAWCSRWRSWPISTPWVSCGLIWPLRWRRSVITTLLATVVEAYTPADFDNLTVPAAALAALWIIIPILDWWQVSFLLERGLR